MALIKISQLPASANLNANPSKSYFPTVDSDTQATTKISGKALGDTLFANNILYVGKGGVSLTNLVAQFTGTDSSYIQTSVQNLNAAGSSDYVITADDGTNNSYYLDLGYNNSGFSDPQYSAMGPHDGYLYVHGPIDHSGPNGNLLLGTVAKSANIVFSVGGLLSSNVISRFNKNSVTFLKDVYVSGANVIVGSGSYYFSDGTVQQSASIKKDYIESSFSIANSAYTTANSGVTLANAAFNKANNALPNTTGVFAGSLTTTGNLIAQFSVRVNNASMPANAQYIVVTGTAGGAIGIPSNPGYTFHSAVDGGNRIVNESYSNIANNYSSFIGRRARGTALSPSAIQNGDIIVRFGGNGYGATKFSQFSDARIEFVASENHTDTSKGTKIRFLNTNNGTNVSSEIASFNSNVVTFTGTVNPQKGFIFSTNVSGTEITKTIDFEKESLIKFNVDADATITLTNFVDGKVVELWITNSAAQNKVITHGCLANNSTAKSTSFTILAQSCAYLRYFSINGTTLANTFVSIVA